MSLAEAGDAVHPRPMSGQAWGIYERGERSQLHRPDIQDRMAAAVSATREDLHREVQRLAGGDTHGGAAKPSQAAFAPPSRSLSVPVLGRAKPSAERGGVVYDARQADSTADLAWLFGPTAGHLRMGDDRLKGRVEAGQLIHYDRALPPRTGQVCVVEATDGLHVYVYRELAAGKLALEQTNPPQPVEFDLADVRGVYAARLIGD